MGLLKNSLLGLSLILGGCAPSALQIGAGIAEARGNYRFISERQNVPYGRVEVRTKLSEKLEGDLHFDFVRGGFGFRDFGIEHEVVGDLQGIGTGIHYFLTDDASLDFGIDAMRVDGDATARWPFGNIEINSTGIGISANVSVTKYFTLDKRTSFFISGGYGFSTNFGERINYNFSGGYGMIGLRISLDVK